MMVSTALGIPAYLVRSTRVVRGSFLDFNFVAKRGRMRLAWEETILI